MGRIHRICYLADPKNTKITSLLLNGIATQSHQVWLLLHLALCSLAQTEGLLQSELLNLLLARRHLLILHNFLILRVVIAFAHLLFLLHVLDQLLLLLVWLRVDLGV